jgi:hypothetical protein
MKGISFTAPMRAAIREGRKTQTRRVMRSQPVMVTDTGILPWEGDPAALLRYHMEMPGRGPRYLPGETAYVREPWVQSISEEDARAEGAGAGQFGP